jgi:hypothetical protein
MPDKKTKYKYVYPLKKRMKGVTHNWTASRNGISKQFEDDLDAAKWIDLGLIKEGKDPVNNTYKKL